MSKFFKWFKKDKQTQESENPNSEQVTEQVTEGKVELDEKSLAEKQAQLKENVSFEEKTQRDENAPLENKLSSEKETPLKPTEPKEVRVQVPHENGASEEKKVIGNGATAHVEENSEELKPALQEQQALDQHQNADSEPSSEPGPETSEEAKAAQELGFYARLKASLSRTKSTIGIGFTSLLKGKVIDEDLYEELETQLLLADVGMTTTHKIIDELTKNAKLSQLKDGGALSSMLQTQMQTILDKVNKPLDFSIASDENGKKQPFVILMVGVNGVGKTTTIGKLAKQFQAQGKSVMLAAGDTFRAAAVEQLQVWGERNDISVVAQHTGADSASVIFDAIESAKAKKVDVLIADTAGRLQNKDHLIEELKKVVRVMKKLDPQAPHEIMLTLDATTGQNSDSQTRIFNEAVGVSGINLTKLDGTAKGGVIFALAEEFAIPVRYIGIGEGIDDLRTFESKAFVDALFSE
jgi:fused signal recognition particle receptor